MTTWNSCHKRGGAPLRVLGINPWIYDFAAYNLWSRPTGLLACLDMLRNAGADVALLDCLDPGTDPEPCWPRPKPSGRGHYPKTPLPRPGILAHVPRKYGRYGASLNAVRRALAKLDPRPDTVLVACHMTYWYPGAAAAADLARKIWPDAPVILGGVYPTLCPDHAKSQSPADLIIQGPLENPQNWRTFWEFLGRKVPDIPENAGLSLALDLYENPGYAPILGSRGCPFACRYCASKRLFSGFVQARFEHVWTAFKNQYDRGVRDFAFYDDALLVNPETWLIPFLDHVAAENLAVRLHAPNAMHVRHLTPDICAGLKRAGLTTVRLGLETGDFDHRHDAKLTLKQWKHGARCLVEAGFAPQDIGVYVLFGLPGQTWEEFERALDLARAQGFRPIPAQYTPIPGSAMFEEACAASPYPLAEEPLCQNNSIWPCVPGGFSWENQRRLKDLVGSG